MKNSVNKWYPCQVWLATAFSFPALCIAYRLLHWKAAEFSVQGLSYLFLVAICTGGVLTMPSFFLSDLFFRRRARPFFNRNAVRLLTAAVSVVSLLATLAAVDHLLYALHANFQLLVIVYSLCSSVACFVFTPIEKGTDGKKIQKHRLRSLFRISGIGQPLATKH